MTGARFTTQECPATNVAIKAGTYSVGETEDPGYAVSYSTDCNGTIALGETRTCTITNKDIGPKLTLTKQLINDNGGTALPAAWTLSASGPGTISGSTGSAAVTNATVLAETYKLSESGGPAGYSLVSLSCVNNSGQPVSGNQIALALADVATCTFMNNDQPSYLTIKKEAEGGDGAFGFTVSGPTPLTPNGWTTGGSGASGPLQVNAGPYTLNESSLPPNWVLTASPCEVSNQTFGTPMVVNGVNVS